MAEIETLKHQHIDNKRSELGLPKKLLGKDKKIRAQIKSANYQKKLSEKYTKIHNYLLEESGGFLIPDENEQTLKFRQKDLLPLLPMQNKFNVFDLRLELGPYYVDYTRNGQQLLIAGRKGHVALLDWKSKTLKTEFQLKETIRDIKALHDSNLFAVAQKKYTFIYDNNGIEIHKLKSHLEPAHLEFLPYHYLLVTSSRLGFLKYHDVSTGNIVSEYNTKIRDPLCMKQNPQNAIIGIGDQRGVVSMYAPNSTQPLVKMLCHKSSVLSLSFHNNGNYLVTTGNDGLMKVWDLRNYKKLFDYWTPKHAKCSDISQKGLLAISNGFQLNVWKDWHIEKQKIPYMKQEIMGESIINDLKFVPYEDFIGVGLENGFSSLVIPGSGEANFDTFEVNVFETKNQKREHLVKSLLEKLPPDSITLNPSVIGNIDAASKEIIEAEKQIEEKENQEKIKKKKKNKMRGRSSIGNVLKIKESVHDEKTRERLKDIANSKIKMKKVEKEKIKKEMELLDNFDDGIDIETIKLTKKKIKLN